MMTWPPAPPGSEPADLRALLDGAHSEPEEEAPRLVLADWLDERGDPRGTLLRGKAKREWFSEYLPTWLGPLTKGWSCWRAERGLLCLEADPQDRQPLPEPWLAAARAGWVETLALHCSPQGPHEPDAVSAVFRRLELTFRNDLPQFGDQRFDLTGWSLLHSLRMTPSWFGTIAWERSLPRVELPGGLRVLDLSDSPRMDGSTLRTLRLPGGLRAMNLGGCTDLTGDGLTALAGLAHLRHLNLQRNQHVGDDEFGGTSPLVQLAGLRELQTLDLEKCWRVGDVGVGALAVLTSLRRLNLRGCWRVSMRALARLREALPGCRVLW